MHRNDRGDTSNSVSNSQTPEILDQLRSLLIVRLRNLGDCVLMTPVLDVLKRWRPELKISVLVESAFAPVFEGNPCVGQLLVPVRAKGLLGKHRGRLATIKRLRSMRFDLVWNLHGGSTSLLYSLSPDARYTLGFRHYRHASRYSLLAPSATEVWQCPQVHTVLTQLAPLRWLGVDIDQRKIETSVYCTPLGEAVADEFLRENGLNSGEYVLIQPTATLKTKQWPELHFAELARNIARRFRMRAVVAAGPCEERIAQAVAEKAGNAAIVFAHRGLDALKSLIARCSCFVGNDSGPTHLAAALQRPVLVLFGSSNYSAWRPWGTDYEAIRADLPCIPCPGYRCYEFDQPRCIRSISPETVFEAFCRLWARNQHGNEESRISRDR